MSTSTLVSSVPSGPSGTTANSTMATASAAAAASQASQAQQTHSSISLDSTLLSPTLQSIDHYLRNTQKILMKDWTTISTENKNVQECWEKLQRKRKKSMNTNTMPVSATATTSTAHDANSKSNKNMTVMSQKEKLQLLKHLSTLKSTLKTTKKHIEDMDKLSIKSLKTCRARMEWMAKKENILLPSSPLDSGDKGSVSKTSNTLTSHSQSPQQDPNAPSGRPENIRATSSSTPNIEPSQQQSPGRLSKRVRSDAQIATSSSIANADRNSFMLTTLEETGDDADRDRKRSRERKDSRVAMDIDSDEKQSGVSTASHSRASSISTKPHRNNRPTSAHSPSTLQATPTVSIYRILVDYMLRLGCYESAQSLINATSIQAICDLELFLPLKRIQLTLDQQDASRALAWYGEHRSRLNRFHSSLEFQLRLQEFLQMVKKQSINNAIEHIQKHIAPAILLPREKDENSNASTTTNPSTTHPQNGTDKSKVVIDSTIAYRMISLREVMGAMIFYKENDSVTAIESTTSSSNNPSEDLSRESNESYPIRLAMARFPSLQTLNANFKTSDVPNSPSVTSSTAASKYHSYWSSDRWKMLASELTTNHLRVNALTSNSILFIMLNAGLAALRTSLCTPSPLHAISFSSLSSPEDSISVYEKLDPVTVDSHNPNCPTCQALFHRLASSLPMAQRTHSQLLCRLSGQVMDENNPPLALPNGYVYSREALTAAADANQGFIICPRTLTTFQLSSCKPAYVL